MMPCLDPPGVLSFGWNFRNTPVIFGSAILGFLLQWSGALALGIQKEEAKIVAWESQQKAKAKATIRKLEMKLEKKRSSSMDKILNKLRRAQMKAGKMRSSMAMPQKQEQGQQGKQNSNPLKVFSLPNYIQLWSSSRCFSTYDH
ncbi:uncharacterized protein LOC107632937 isoform X2 [Arachis ipaensis]|uniref:uncharacterized protein LOC107632937 isoform X2 n=1 Tax=Arachis ipaensis TaxID=130454 RepID=UPI000A2B775A|nr:uncharacterized protein LOC107632937 isoform X2 [Arachis ipaensis]